MASGSVTGKRPVAGPGSITGSSVIGHRTVAGPGSVTASSLTGHRAVVGSHSGDRKHSRNTSANSSLREKVPSHLLSPSTSVFSSDAEDSVGQGRRVRRTTQPSQRSTRSGLPTIPSVTDHTELYTMDKEPSKSQSPGGWMSNRGARAVLSRYTIPAMLWLASQILAVIVVSVISELVTYDALIQLTNIDSMLSHIGMYASAVNAYLTVHAQQISKLAQDAMVEEYNIHLHHIAKVKAILENDLVSYPR